MGTLPDVGSAVEDGCSGRRLVAFDTEKMDLRLAAFGEPEGEPDVLVCAGDAAAPPDRS